MVLRIPYDEIEVTEGWRVVDLATLEDCDAAMLHLARDVASIEAQLEEFGRDSDLGAEVSDDDADWQRKARAALRIKREIRQLVQNRRGDIGKAAKRTAAEAHDRRLLTLLQAMAPDVFAAAVAQLRGV